MVFTFSDLAVKLFLEDKWGKVSLFMCILIVGNFFFQFICSALSKTLMIVNKQELGLILFMLALALRYILM